MTNISISNIKFGIEMNNIYVDLIILTPIFDGCVVMCNLFA